MSLRLETLFVCLIVQYRLIHYPRQDFPARMKITIQQLVHLYTMMEYPPSKYLRTDVAPTKESRYQKGNQTSARKKPKRATLSKPETDVIARREVVICHYFFYLKNNNRGRSWISIDITCIARCSQFVIQYLEPRRRKNSSVGEQTYREQS